MCKTKTTNFVKFVKYINNFYIFYFLVNLYIEYGNDT